MNIKTKLLSGVCAMLIMGTMVVSDSNIDEYNVIMPRFFGVTNKE